MMRWEREAGWASSFVKISEPFSDDRDLILARSLTRSRTTIHQFNPESTIPNHCVEPVLAEIVRTTASLRLRDSSKGYWCRRPDHFVRPFLRVESLSVWLWLSFSFTVFISPLSTTRAYGEMDQPSFQVARFLCECLTKSQSIISKFLPSDIRFWVSSHYQSN